MGTFLANLKDNIVFWYNFLFNNGPYLPKKDCTIGNFTVGEPDENNIARVYRDGEPTNITMLVFTTKQVEKIRKVQDELEKKHNI